MGGDIVSIKRRENVEGGRRIGSENNLLGCALFGNGLQFRFYGIVKALFGNTSGTVINSMRFKLDHILQRTFLLVENCDSIVWFTETSVIYNFSWPIYFICFNLFGLNAVILCNISASNLLLYHLIFVHFGITSAPFSWTICSGLDYFLTLNRWKIFLQIMEQLFVEFV